MRRHKGVLFAVLVVLLWNGSAVESKCKNDWKPVCGYRWLNTADQYRTFGNPCLLREQAAQNPRRRTYLDLCNVQ